MNEIANSTVSKMKHKATATKEHSIGSAGHKLPEVGLQQLESVAFALRKVFEAV